MHATLFRSFVPVLLLLLCIACTNEQPEPAPESKEEVPESIRGLENVAVYSLDDFPDPDSVVLEEELVITVTDYSSIDGFASDLVVDDSSRIYINAGSPGSVGISIFEEDGTYVGKFLRTGRGPGEVEAIASMRYRDGKIYGLDARLQKVVIYRTSDLKALRDRVLEKNPDMEDQDLFNRIRAKEIFIANDGDPILKYNSWRTSDTLSYSYYFRMDDDGMISSTFDHKTPRIHFYPYEMEMQDKNNPSIPWPYPMPFGNRTIVRQDQDGNFYENWTEELLIKVYDNDWNYLRSVYYDMPKYVLDLDDVDISDSKKEATEGQPVPEYWPVVQNFQIDDEKRMWVSTFTESDSVYQWYVLNPDGSLIGTFSSEENRDENFTLSDNPFPVIHKGYHYTQNLNTDTWVNKVFKKKIRLIERN